MYRFIKRRSTRPSQPVVNQYSPSNLSIPASSAQQTMHHHYACSKQCTITRISQQGLHLHSARSKETTNLQAARQDSASQQAAHLHSTILASNAPSLGHARLYLQAAHPSLAPSASKALPLSHSKQRNIIITRTRSKKTANLHTQLAAHLISPLNKNDKAFN